MDVTDPHRTTRLLSLSPDSCLLNGKMEFVFLGRKENLRRLKTPAETAQWLEEAIPPGVCSVSAAGAWLTSRMGV